MNILVTGIAGDIGNGIGRILRERGLTQRLIGCDLHGEHLGESVFDACETVPRASTEGYITALKNLVERERVDAIVVTSEPELRFFNALTDKDQIAGLNLVMANEESMSIGFDKLRTAEFISSIGCASPWTKAVEAGAPEQYPCILKSRSGAGGQGVYIVKDQALVESYRKISRDCIWQEYIPGDQEEYTCGVYGCGNGEIRTIIFRRRLSAGVTSYAELVENKEIESLCIKVGIALKLRGSINIQLRLSPRGPLVFEINPRFSSTVVFRHKLGFSDLVWSVQEQIQGKATSYTPTHPVGTKMYRVFNEEILRP